MVRVVVDIGLGGEGGGVGNVGRKSYCSSITRSISM